MRKFLAAVLLSTVVFASCGGHNASPVVPGGYQQAGPGANDSTGTPRGTDAAPVANAGPYGFGITYSAQLYSGGSTPVSGSDARIGGRHPLTAVTPTPTPTSTPCPAGFTGTPPTCILNVVLCPPMCGGCPPACGPSPTPSPTPTAAPTLPPTPGSALNAQFSPDCLIAPQTLTQQNPGASNSSPALQIGSGYGRIIRNNTKTNNSVTSTSYVGAVNVLSSLITADYVSATAGATLQAPSGSTLFRNLKINGQLVTVTGQPNQTITIPNVGHVVLNEQGTNGGPFPGGVIDIAQTIGIHLYIDSSNYPYGLAPGYDIVVGLAAAAIGVPLDGSFPTVQAYGYGNGTGTTLIDNITDSCGQSGIDGGQNDQYVSSYNFGTDGVIDGMDTYYQVSQGGPVLLYRAKHASHWKSASLGSSGQTTVSSWNRNIPIGFGATLAEAGTWIDYASLGSDFSVQGMDIETGVFRAPPGLIGPGAPASGVGTQAYVNVQLLAAGGKTFTNATLPSNLRVTIPNLGYVILAQTINTSTGSGPYVTDVIGAHLYVTVSPNSHGLAKGDYIIGRAHSDITVMSTGLLPL